MTNWVPLKCYYDQIFDYHLFSLDWQFSTWSTWCANYSFIRLRKVVFFGAQKPLIFVRHLNAMFLWPGYQELKAIALWRHLLNAVHTAWEFFLPRTLLNNVPFPPTSMRSCLGRLFRSYYIRLRMCAATASIVELSCTRVWPTECEIRGIGLFPADSFAVFSVWY